METKAPGSLELSPDQQHAHDTIVAWYEDRKELLITLGGYAGTGKTTLTAAIAATLRKKHKNLIVAFVCFTGKAASVLKRKLDRAGALKSEEHCGTIHKLIYTPRTDINGRIIGWYKAPKIDADLVVLDEASMVDEQLFKDLASYGKPILAVGDHGQLPPIKEGFNLMADPQLRLEHIHRQAADNPIIKASMLVRLKGTIPYCNWDGKVIKVPPGTDIVRFLDSVRETLFITSTNKTRIALNQRIRETIGAKSLKPGAGDKVICLKNNRDLGIFNGMTGVIQEIRDAGEYHYFATLKMDGIDEPIAQKINKLQFGNPKTLQGNEIAALDRRQYGLLFDWGYAMTAHKAQGSEAAQVVVYDDCDWMKDEDMRRRWRYTAYTRAAEKLIIVGR